MRSTLLPSYFIILVILCFSRVSESSEDAWPETVRFNTGGLERNNFPKGFVFGTATSAYQVEGMANKDGRRPSIWDVFIKIPGKIANNATADVTVDQYHRYKEDVDLMEKLNFDAYRFSISWSRIFPNGTGRVNWKGVAYYNRLIDYLLEKGITPYANLYHYDLPEALEKKYKGFLSRRVMKDYANYADFCFKTFGDRVKNWMTFNEPRVVAALGYDNGIFPPGRCSKEFGNCTAGNSATEPYIVAHNFILSHAAAVQRYREKYQEKQKGRIGILLDFVWFEPLTRGKADQYAAQRARDFCLGWFLQPIVYGEYPKTMQNIVGERLPKFTKSEVNMVKGSMDFLGVNQYTTYYMYDPHLAKQNVTGYQRDWNVGFAFERNGVPIGRKEKQKGRIGILLDFVWFEPLTRGKADQYAAQRARDFCLGWFLQPIVYGEYPKTMQNIVGERLPKFTKSEVNMVKGSMDFLGVNQYTTYYMYDPHLAKQNVTGYQRDWNVGFAFEHNGVPIGRKANSNWLYEVPWGIYKAVTYIKERYGNPTMILSENGMDDPGNVTLPKGLHDITRINYYKNYLIELKKAIDDGANVTGYFAWSLVDNFEWLSGYTSRFGIVYVDYNDLKRYPKMSAYWFKKLLHGKKH